MGEASDYAHGWMASEAEDHDKINVKRIYIDMNGGNFFDGVMFSQIMYWHGKNEHGKSRMQVHKEGEYWLAKQYEDWWDECRINERTARQCINRMVKSGLLIKRLWHFAGKPTVHIRVNWDVFSYRVKMLRHEMSFTDSSTRHEMSNRSGLSDIKRQIHSTPDVNPYTETTTETTKQTETKEPAPSAGEGSAISHTDLIKAWLDETKTIDPSAYKKKPYHELAKAMLGQDITPEDIRRFVQDKRREKYWKTRAIPFGTVAAEILAWKDTQQLAAQQPVPVENPARPEYPYSSWSEEQHQTFDEAMAAAIEKLNGNDGPPSFTLKRAG